MYDNMVEARKKAAEEKPKPRIIGGIKLYE
jgi:hypothetical protein